jgi:hypothetical protein
MDFIGNMNWLRYKVRGFSDDGEVLDSVTTFKTL